MRSVVRALSSFALGALACLVLLEAVLRWLPVNGGLQPAADGKRAPLHNYEPHRRYRYSNTWAMLNPHEGTTNNYGHIAPHDFGAGARPVLVIGDSFIESLMNPYDDTIQGVLGRRLGPRGPVYGLGASGLSASDYVVLADQARAEFAPKAAVFLIEDGDMSESLSTRPGGYHLAHRPGGFELGYVPLTPNPLMQWVRSHVGEPAVLRYLRSNLKFSPSDIVRAVSIWRPAARSGATAQRNVVAEQVAVVDWFLGHLSAATGVAPRCTVLLIDADRYAIYDRRAATPPKDVPEARAHLIAAARQGGFKIVDLGPLFAAAYRRDRLKLDYWPVDRHWNRVGHRVAAEAAMAELLASDEPPCLQPGAAGDESRGRESDTRGQRP